MVPVGAIAALIVYAMRAGRRGSSPAPATAASSIHLVGLLKSFAVVIVWAILLAIVPFVVPLWFAIPSWIWMATVGLHWIAWRVCYPLRLWRLGRVVLWLAPHLRQNHEAGRMALWAAAGGQALPAGAIDGWTACAAVMEAERAGRYGAAGALVDALLTVALGDALPASVRSRGIELIAQAAAERGDWPEVLRRASLGRGRGPRFLRLLARAHVVGDVRPWLLRTAWVLAPGRLTRYAMLRGALAAAPRVRRPPVPIMADAGDAPWRCHMRLLARAAAGVEIELADVIALARRWDEPLAPAGEALFRARGLELGSTRAQETFRGLRESVAADLTAMARGARGVWPAGADPSGLALDLHGLLADESFEAVEAIARTRRHKKLEDLGTPLDEWRLWIRFHAAVAQLAARFGEEELKTAWYGGAQLAAWNWPCHLLEKYGDKAAWACHVMFRWTTETAERCGDEEAATVNRRNADTARKRIRAA